MVFDRTAVSYVPKYYLLVSPFTMIAMARQIILCTATVCGMPTCLRSEHVVLNAPVV